MSQPFENEPFGQQQPSPHGADGERQPTGERIEPLHQPPDANDLLQSPPADATCARMRSMLRDFVDHDLDAASQGEVEQHVHTCRTCALALARAEYEVFRIRSGFLGSWAAIGPRPGFSKRTVARLLSETSSDRRLPYADSGVGSALAGAVAPSTLAARVVAAIVAEEAAAPSASASRNARRRVRRAWRRLDLRAVMVASALAVLASVALYLPFQNATGLANVVRLSIVDAHRAWSDVGFDRHRVRPGDGFGAGAALVVDAGGLLDVEWHDASMTGEQPAAAITMRGDGELRLQDGLPQLMRGTVHISSKRQMSLLLGDGSSVSLGAGDYHVSATELSSAFDRLAEDSPLAVRVEVLDGDAAMLAFANGAGRLIGAGQAGRYNNAFGGIAVDNLPSPLQDARVATKATPPVDPVVEPDLRAGVIDDRASGVAGCSVHLEYPTATGLRVRELTTNSVGVFELPPASDIVEGYALVSVVPPENRGLGASLVDARLVRSSSSIHTLPTTELQSSPPMSGAILDAAHRGIQGATVVPVVYDELLGMVGLLPEVRVTVDESGRFELNGLPVRMPGGLTLALLVCHEGYDMAFAPLPAVGSRVAAAGPIAVELQQLRTISIESMPPSATVEIYEELNTMPVPGVLLRRRVVVTSPQGRVELSAGYGRFWLRSGTDAWPKLRRIAEASPGVCTVDAAERSMTSVFRAKVWDLDRVFEASDQDVRLCSQRRFDALAPASPASQSPLLVVAPSTTSLQNLPEVQAFALRPYASGGYAATFVGLQHPEAGLPSQFQGAETRIVALQGAMSQSRLTASFNQPNGRLIELQACGAIEVAAGLIPQSRAVCLKIEPEAGTESSWRSPMFRFVHLEDATAANIPPGQYVVTGEGLGSNLRSVTVHPGQVTEIR